MAQIRKRQISTLQVDRQRLELAFARAVLRHHKERIPRGEDGDGRPMPPYSPLYRLQLQATGDSGAVDGQRSKGLLQALRALRVRRSAAGFEIQFGAGNTTSPNKPRPPWWVFHRTKTPAQRARSLALWQAAPKRMTRSPSHSIVLERLLRGGGGGARRRLLGISPRGRGPIAREMEREKIFRT